MKRISAPAEPPCFDAWRAAHPRGTWEEFKHENRGSGRCSDAVMSALIAAQHGLCAYCEITLDPPLWAEVEHWHPKDPAQSSGHNWGLDFSNFMAACEGGTRDKPDRGRALPPIARTCHCGAAKKNADLTTSLLDPRVDVPATPNIWHIVAEGRMSVNEGAAGALAPRATETIERLRLDSPVLTRLRAQVWSELDKDVVAAWETLGGAEDDYEAARTFVAAERLGLSDGLLQAFWSTARSYFGSVSETWIALHPEVF